MLNHVELLGRLAQEPEIRYTTQTQIPVATFDLTVPVYSKNGDAPPDYIPIVCWDKKADFVERFLSKGRQIVVEGRIKTRKYTDNDGRNRKVVEVVASNIYFADSNHQNSGNGNNGDADNYPPEGFSAITDEDIPF